jgi:hypothetical protein
MNTVEFDKHYKKLDDPVFSTIRTPNTKIKENTVYIINSPMGIFKAEAVMRVDIALKDIPEKELCRDTDTKTRGEAFNLLRSFYPKLKPGSKIAWVWFSKCSTSAPALKQSTL